MINLLKNSLLAWELKKLAKKNKGMPLSLMDDVVFKAMLSANNEDSREALRSLLSACTRRNVAAVQVLNSELLPAYFGAKMSRVDVHVRFNDGEIADLEMQIGIPDDDLKKRSEFYAGSLVAGQMPRGKKYRDIKRVYQVFFLNRVLFPQSGKFPRRYFYQEEAEHDRLSETSEIIFYEFPKLEQRFKDFQEGKLGMENLTDDEKWCIFIRYRHEEHAGTQIEQICHEEVGIMRAEKAVTRLSRDDRMYARRVAEMKNQYDRLVYEESVRKDEKQGIARKMKDMGMSVEQIIQATGLSQEDIEKL
jgi:predicted transposase/invertase (TIGR01784 family)